MQATELHGSEEAIFISFWLYLLKWETNLWFDSAYSNYNKYGVIPIF